MISLYFPTISLFTVNNHDIETFQLVAQTGFEPGTFPSLHASSVPGSQICDMALLIRQVGLFSYFKQKYFTCTTFWPLCSSHLLSLVLNNNELILNEFVRFVNHLRSIWYHSKLSEVFQFLLNIPVTGRELFLGSMVFLSGSNIHITAIKIIYTISIPKFKKKTLVSNVLNIHKIIIRYNGLHLECQILEMLPHKSHFCRVPFIYYVVTFRAGGVKNCNKLYFAYLQYCSSHVNNKSRILNLQKISHFFLHFW